MWGTDPIKSKWEYLILTKIYTTIRLSRIVRVCYLIQLKHTYLYFIENSSYTSCRQGMWKRFDPFNFFQLNTVEFNVNVFVYKIREEYKFLN